MMNVYILRHAAALQRGIKPFPNDDRPLTEEGLDKMSREARGIVRVVDDLDVILASPMERARDTALIVAKAFRAESKVQVCNELAPGSSLKHLMSYLAKYKKLRNILLVGHEPDLSYFASALLGKSSLDYRVQKRIIMLHRSDDNSFAAGRKITMAFNTETTADDCKKGALNVPIN